MTLLEYALKLVDQRLADLKVIEDRLVTLNTEVTTPALQADVRRLTIDYADERYRLLQQKQHLLDEAMWAIDAVRETPTWTVVH